MHKRTLPGGTVRWRVHFRDPAGRQRVETWLTKRDAERRKTELDHVLIRGDWIDPALGAVTVADWAQEWLGRQTHIGDTTRSLYDVTIRLHLGRLGTMPLDRVTPDDVRRWSQALPGSPRSQQMRLGHLTMILQAAVDDQRLKTNPAGKVKSRKVPRTDRMFLSAGELEALASAVEPRDRALILVAGWGGLRWGEVTGLRRHRVDIDRGRVHVVEQIAKDPTGKLRAQDLKTRSSVRNVTLPRSVAVELAEHMGRWSQDGRTGLVFTADRGGPVQASNWRARVWLPTTAKVGLGGLRFHDLRHTAASLAIASGASVSQVMAMLGHSTSRLTLDLYGHLFPEAGDDLAARLEAMRVTAV